MPKGVLACSVGRLLLDLIWTAVEMAEPSENVSVQCHGVKRRVSLLAVELDVAFACICNASNLAESSQKCEGKLHCQLSGAWNHGQDRRLLNEAFFSCLHVVTPHSHDGTRLSLLGFFVE